MSPTFSTWLDLYGFPIKSSLLSDVVINTQRKRKQKHRRRILRNMFLLFNIPHSICFGKFGGRCKSLQCWMKSCMCAAMERRVFAYVCFNEISLQKRKLSPHSSFAAGEVRGLCPPALKWPLAMSQGLSDKTTMNQSPPRKKTQKERNKTKQNISGAVVKVRKLFRVFQIPSLKLEREGKPTRLTWALKLRHLIISPKPHLKKSCHSELFSDSMSLVLGIYCPFWPNLQWHEHFMAFTDWDYSRSQWNCSSNSILFVWLASVQNIPICSWQEGRKIK